MAEAIRDALGPVLTRWTMGGSAVPDAPAEWRDKLGDDAREAELRLLALSGQFLGALVHIEPAGEVRALADIPALTRPPLPDALRPLARRVLQQLREPAQRRDLFDFLDARGWTLHPGDWMPGAKEEVPEVYAAWQGWVASGASAPTTDAPTAESWDMLSPAARRATFVALRRRDPMRASALLAEKIGGETPAARARLLEALAIGLSDADRPLLEGLAADRSPRVKAQVALLLARLGDGAAGNADAVELAGFFSIESKGLLRRGRSIAATEPKTMAQRDRRTALMESVLFDAFAHALELSPAELVAAWPWGSDSLADQTFAAMVADSGSDAIVAAAAEALTAGASLDTVTLAPLVPRLSRVHRRQAAMQILRAKGGSFAQALTIAGGDGGIDGAMDTAAGAALRVALKADAIKPAEPLALGLLASRSAARQALEQLTAGGLIASDPQLDMLRLNAALEDRSELKGATE